MYGTPRFLPTSTIAISTTTFKSPYRYSWHFDRVSGGTTITPDVKVARAAAATVESHMLRTLHLRDITQSQRIREANGPITLQQNRDFSKPLKCVAIIWYRTAFSPYRNAQWHRCISNISSVASRDFFSPLFLRPWLLILHSIKDSIAWQESNQHDTKQKLSPTSH